MRIIAIDWSGAKEGVEKDLGSGIQPEKSEDAFDAVFSACIVQKFRAQILSLAPTADPTTRIEGSIWSPQQATQ